MHRTVTRDGWNVSITSPRYDEHYNQLPGVELHVFKIHETQTRRAVFQYGEGYGKVFENSDAAWLWALQRGYLQPYVHPWCRACRKQHYFLGKRTGFCTERAA